jgi:hypothetical protein
MGTHRSSNGPTIRSLRGRVAVCAGSSAVAVLIATGCSAVDQVTGPTCDEFIHMSSADQKQTVIDWATAHDDRVDDADPEGKSGFILFADLGSMTMYCQQPGHGDDRIENLRT